MDTTQRKRTILVVEDDEVNRGILSSILEDEYEVIQAADGLRGLVTLDKYDREGRIISLVLLDIQMPVLNGYQFLEKMEQRDYNPRIPVIISTGSNHTGDEIACLEKGAADFITKPYNKDIMLLRIANIIRLNEASTLLGKVEHDSLTGLYSREFFYDHAAYMLDSNPDEEFDMVCTDIDAFKLVNDRYGEDRGDRMLAYLASKLLEEFPSPAICGRINGDIFAVLCPHKDFEKHEADADDFVSRLDNSPVPNTYVYFGVYCNVDRKHPISVLCDNAQLAIKGIKHSYTSRIAQYNQEVREQMYREQVIINNMELALEERQFKVYFQPKHLLHKDCTGGAEALVRWIHPEFGFMNPGEFIPLFEKNGFIQKMDTYMLEETCRLQRKWIDSGINVVPVSVNVSRADFERSNLADTLSEIVDRYNLSHDLIHLEVTESIYMERPELIAKTVAELKKRKFEVELDDFGAGYSSLGVLTELFPDVLKLDMSLVRTINTDDQRVLISHIISMANDFNMRTVAEGVEDKEQMEILKALGCDYIQGYYYSKPLPADEFEEYLKK